MTGPLPPQQELFARSPELQRVAELQSRILSLTSNRLPAPQHDKLRQLLGELKSASWTSGYRAHQEEIQP